MMYVRFGVEGRERYGIQLGKTIHEITPHYFGPYRKTGKKYALSKVTLLAPCVPTKIVALGLNYLDHAEELRMPIPLHPLMFLKASSSIAGPHDDIVYPSISRRVDFEAELAIVIKKRCRNVSEKKACDYVLGYTCMNDVTARDIQRHDGQWARAKSFDTFAPIGPCIVDDIDPHNVKIESYLNNKKKQSSNTKDLIFKVEEIIASVSTVMTLMPGDVIATGTPPGVGRMGVGDTVRVKIEKIGELKNKVVAS